MSMLYVRPSFNLVPGALSSTVSPAADSLFPASNAGDRITASIFKFGSIAADSYIWWDFDKIGDKGEFETWAAGSPDGWTEANTGGSDITQTTVGAEVHNGTSAAKLTVAGGGIALMYRDFTCPAGAKIKLDVWGRGDGGTGTVRFQLVNLQTGNTCLGGSSWIAGTIGVSITVGSSASTTYQNLTSEIVVESYAACLTDLVTLRLYIWNSVNGTSAFADSVIVVPGVNFASIHGHNVDPLNTLKLRSSDLASAGSFVDRGTFPKIQPSTYISITDRYARYFQIMVNGTNSTATGAPYFGEVVIGDALTLATGPRMPMSASYRDARIDVPMRWGSQTYSVGQHATRSFPFTCRATSMTARLEIMDELYRRSKGGTPAVIVPHNADSHTDVYYGRISPEAPHEWQTRSVVDISSSIEELPFPFVTS